MRRIGISLLIVGLVFGLFIFGLFGGNTVPMLIGFCGWTPAIFALGYNVAKAGIRIVVASEDKPAPAAAKISPFSATPNRIKRLQEQ